MAEALLQVRQKGKDPVVAILTVVDESTLQATVTIAKNHMWPPNMDYRDLLANRGWGVELALRDSPNQRSETGKRLVRAWVWRA